MSKLGEEVDLLKKLFKQSLTKHAVQRQLVKLQSKSWSSNAVSWQMNNPAPNAILDTEGYMIFDFNITMSNPKGAPNAEDLLPVSKDVVVLSDYDAVSNIISNISCNVNGQVISMSPNVFNRALNIVSISKKDATEKFKYCGGTPDNVSTGFNSGLLGRVHNVGGQHDPYWSWTQRFQRTPDKATPGMGYARTTVGNWGPNIQVVVKKMTESYASRMIDLNGADATHFTVRVKCPIICPPFNYWKKLKCNKHFWQNKLPDYIPHWNNGEINVQFQQNISAGLMQFLFGAHTAGNANTTTTLTAELRQAPVLELIYYRPPPSVPIYSSYNFNIWNVQNFRKNLPANLTWTLATCEPVPMGGISSDVIQLNGAPDLLLIYIQQVRSGASYNCQVHRTLDNANTACELTQNGNNFARIHSFNMTVNTDSGAITQKYTTDNLYDMFLDCVPDKNDVPFDMQGWAQNRCIVAMRGKHFPTIGMSSGVAGKVNFQINDVIASQAWTADPAGCTFEMVITACYGKMMLNMKRDTAMTSYQQIPSNQAIRSLAKASSSSTYGGTSRVVV